MEYVKPSSDRVGAYFPNTNLPHVHRIWFPREIVHMTNGLYRHDLRLPPTVSVCVLFQRGRCLAGRHCNQLHVEPSDFSDIMSRIERIDKRNFCCVFHRSEDTPSNGLFQRFASRCDIVVSQPGGGWCRVVPGTRLVYTRFWKERCDVMRHYRGHRYEIHESQLCNLHAKGMCKLAQDCHHVHLCGEMYGEQRWWAPADSALPSIDTGAVETTNVEDDEESASVDDLLKRVELFRVIDEEDSEKTDVVS